MMQTPVAGTAWDRGEKLGHALMFSSDYVFYYGTSYYSSCMILTSLLPAKHFLLIYLYRNNIKFAARSKHEWDIQSNPCKKDMKAIQKSQELEMLSFSL